MTNVQEEYNWETYQRPFRDITDPEHIHYLIRKPGGILLFADKILGLPVMLHPGQVRWLKNSTKRINILRPGNKYGKSLIGAVKHIYHLYLKWNMWGMYRTYSEWWSLKYDTLNFGPGYEQAREIPRMVRDIVQGAIFIPPIFQPHYGSTNQSLLKDWFITDDKVDSISMPHLKTYNGSSLLVRSYDDMGAAFKMKGIAYVSGDEVADIRELWTFTNGTLLPRGVAYPNFSIDYYGTPQPDGLDYIRMIEMADENMKTENWKEEGLFYHQRGSMLDNPFLNKQTVQDIMSISDPEMRRQIIEGDHVETGTKYFGFERVMNAIDKDWKPIHEGIPGRRYVVSADFAGGDSKTADFTVIQVIDATEEPYRVVFMSRHRGSEIPIPMQYKLVEEIYFRFKNPSLECKLIIDASALGGKNAQAFLKHLNPITYDVKQVLKAEMLATLKIVLDGGQSDTFKRDVEYITGGNGTKIEKNPTWGLLKIPNVPEYYQELSNYRLNDEKIKTDIVMSLAQAIHYIEMRRPKKIKKKMENFDLLAYW